MMACCAAAASCVCVCTCRVYDVPVGQKTLDVASPNAIEATRRDDGGDGVVVM